MSLENVKNIVLILSGKGGVGKSSITTQLALSLCLAGHSVGILDIDLTGPSIPRLLGIEAAKVKQAPGGWLPVEVHASQILPPAPPSTIPQPTAATPTNGPTTNNTTTNGPTSSDSPIAVPPTSDDADPPPPQIGSLHAMSLAFLLTTRSAAIVWRGPKKTAMVRQFLTSVLWPPTDYLLIDTPPGTSDEHISLVETLLKDVAAPAAKARLAGAVVVTTPQAVAVSDVKKELNFCAKTGVRVLGVVENMSGYVCECCGVAANLFSKGGGELMAREFGVPFLGGVPLDGQWGVLVEEGRRPRYGGVVKDGGEADEDDRDAEEDGTRDVGEEHGDVINGEEPGTGKEDRDEGILVDRYRSCSLCPVFEGIARAVVDTVRSGSAVSVRRTIS
ncbi:cytosolic Fe-S cluster assembly factor cfd1 [Lambiella insularis]|nr:cytosolic Fe-S cluster assembly factor cfd1 [Lambiella insularis]